VVLPDAINVSDSVTILRPLARRVMAKQLNIAPNGQVVQRPYSEAKTFRVEQAPVASLHELLRVLLRIEPDPTACIIRGNPQEGTDLTNTFRRGSKAGGNFNDVPRRWVMLDRDKVKLLAGVSVIDDPHEVARIIVDQIALIVPELEGVTAVVQFSSSAGIEEQAEAEAAVGLPPRWSGVVKQGAGVGAHVWFWLNQPVDGNELDRWAKAINARAGQKLIDPATLRTVQPHYTAGPVFGPGLRDPLLQRRTLLVEGDVDAATLNIPPIEQRNPYKSSEARHDKRGYTELLDAIGGPDGFHEPINRTISSFIANNSPNPDTEVLKAALVERIHAADPGSRSPSQIDRYANGSNLDLRIAWMMDREQDKRDSRARAEAEAAAEPVPPTYPDQGVSIKEAESRVAAALGTFASQSALGAAPQLLCRVTVGSGKTYLAIGALPAILAAGRQAGRGPVLFLHPRHKLGDQIAMDIRNRYPRLKVAIWRGMDADDPENPGKKMCQDPELPRAARAAGQSATAGCPACSLKPTCAYHLQDQAGRNADVWVAPHQMLFTMPFSAWPRETIDGKRVPLKPSAVIIDEDITGSGLKGLNPLDPVQLALSALDSDETPNVTGFERDRLLDLRRQVRETLTGQPLGALFRRPVEWMHETPISDPPGISPVYSMSEVRERFSIGTTSAAREWAALEWKCKAKVKIGTGTTRAEALAAFRAAADQGFTRLLPMLGEQIAAFLASGDARSVNLTLVPDAKLGRGQGTGPVVRFAWRQDFHSAWMGPQLFLDATARSEVLRHWAPKLEVVDIEVAAPHQHVVQVSDQEFGRRWLQKADSVKAIVDTIMVELARADGPVLAIMQKGVEDLIRSELTGRGGIRHQLADDEEEDDPATYHFPSGAKLHLAHHGDVTGSNAWQDMATILVIGRLATDRLDGERIAEVIAGKAVSVVPDAPDSWWPTTTASIRMVDGSGRPVVRQPNHPDPLVEAVRWSTTEGAVLQGIGRVRGVRRTAAHPVRVVLLAALALPLTVTEQRTWDEFRPDRLTVAAAEAALFHRAMPFAPADMNAARPDLWVSPKAAELDKGRIKDPHPLISTSYKGLRGFNRQLSARYRKSGARNWSSALVPPDGGRAALVALLGPLEAYEVIAPQSAMLLAVPVVDSRAAVDTVVVDPPTSPVRRPQISALPTCAGATPPAQPLSIPAPHPPMLSDDLVTTPTRPDPLTKAELRPPAAMQSSPGNAKARNIGVLESEPIPVVVNSRLADLARRLEAVHPPKLWGDFTDVVRLLGWRDRQATARAKWGAKMP
jgi:hypothetical protein